MFCILGSLGIWFSQREKNGIGLTRSLVTSLFHLLPHWPLARWTRWHLLPGHQNSGAPPFFSGFSWWCTLIYAGSVPIKTGNVGNTKIHLGKKTNRYSWSQFLRLKQKPCCQLERAPEFWCPGTRTLVPPHFFGDFLMVYSHLCWQCFEKPGNVRNTSIHLGKKTNWYSWCPFSRLQ